MSKQGGGVISWCHCHLYPLLLHQNTAWFNLAGAGLLRLSWKKAH